MFWKRKPKPVWTFVATVRAHTIWTDADGAKDGETWHYWLLEEKAAERRATFHAAGKNSLYLRDITAHMSPAAAEIKLAVEAWLCGGAVPKSQINRDDWPPKNPPEEPDPEPPLPPDDGVKKSFIDAVLNGTPEDAPAAPKEPAEPAPE